MPLTLQALCQADENVSALMKGGRCGHVALVSLCAVVCGSAVFGAAFGLWRSPEQAFYSAIKMPAMILSLVGISSLINIMLAHVLGSRLSASQTTTCVLLSLGLTCILLAALAPVTLFFASQCPAPADAGAMTAYRWLLAGNTGLVAITGMAGNARLYHLLRELTGTSAVAARVLTGWILVTGLAGCELSWICSPFLARPDVPVPFLNPNAFKSNFFEYLWHAVSGALF